MPASVYPVNERESSIGMFRPKSVANNLDNSPRTGGFVSGVVRNRNRSVQGKNIVMEDPKGAAAALEGEKSLQPTEQSEVGGFSHSGLSKTSPSYDSINQVDPEIRGPFQERTEGTIQFAELPHPVKRERENSRSTTSVERFSHTSFTE